MNKKKERKKEKERKMNKLEIFMFRFVKPDRR